MTDDLSIGSVAGYRVRPVIGARAYKAYRCPGCGGTIARGEGHVVVWPVESMEDRRHWHRHCWRIAVRRGRIT